MPLLEPLGYTSQSISAGEVRISKEPGRAEITVGALLGRSWIAPIIPPVILLGIGSFWVAMLFAVGWRNIEKTPSMLGPLVGVWAGATGLLQLIKKHGGTHVITIDENELNVNWIGLNQVEPVPVSEIMAIRCRRVWWSPMVWALIAYPFPNWWRAQNGLPATKSSAGTSPGNVLFWGRRNAVLQAADALAVFVQNRRAPRAKNWVICLMIATAAAFVPLAIWLFLLSVRSNSISMIGDFALEMLSVIVCFAVLFGFALALDRGRLRDYDGGANASNIQR